VRVALEHDAAESAQLTSEGARGALARELATLIGRPGAAIAVRAPRGELVPADSSVLLARLEAQPEFQRARNEEALRRVAIEEATSTKTLQFGLVADAGLWGTDLLHAVPPELEDTHPGATFSDRMKRDLGASVAIEVKKPLTDPAAGATARARVAALDAARVRREALLEERRRGVFDLVERSQTAFAQLALAENSTARADDNVLRARSLYAGGGARARRARRPPPARRGARAARRRAVRGVQGTLRSGGALMRRLFPLLLALLAFGCGPKAGEEEAVDPLVTVHAEAVTVRTFRDVVEAPGRWRNSNALSVRAPAAGFVETLTPKPGERVSSGQVVGRVLTRESRSAVEGAELLLREAHTDAARAEARRALALAKSELVHVPLVAAHGGFVIARTAEPGAQVDEGADVLTLASPEDLVFEAHVPARDGPLVRPGQSAFITVDPAPPRAATVRTVLPSADSTDQSTVVWLAPTAAAGTPALERFGVARIQVGAPRNSPAVPRRRSSRTTSPASRRSPSSTRAAARRGRSSRSGSRRAAGARCSRRASPRARAS
jgi:hypothetical protein